MELQTLREKLAELAHSRPEGEWPTEALTLLDEAQCWRNVVPGEHGGLQLGARARVRTYEAVSWGDMAVALILTQHDGACELLADCDNVELANELLPLFAKGELLTTVGISQLTTSHRGTGPAMRAEPDGDGYRLTGVMPWVTSARHADHIVTGAVLPDSRQILACVPTRTPGLAVGEPISLMGLTRALTSEVLCEKVFVTPEHLMRGPVEKALARRAPAKSLTVSSCGMGMAGALLEACRQKRAGLPEVEPLLEGTIAPAYQSLRKQLHEAAESLDKPEAEIPAMELRCQVNDLVARLAVTLMTLLKGSGFVEGHPMQRLVREAFFFLVWSAPTMVQTGTLNRLWSSMSCDGE